MDRLGGSVDEAAIDVEDFRSPLEPELAAAIRSLDVDVLVTSNRRLLDIGAAGGVLIPSSHQWLDVANSEVRKQSRARQS